MKNIHAKGLTKFGASLMIFTLIFISVSYVQVAYATTTTLNVKPFALTYTDGNAISEWSTTQVHDGSKSIHIQTTGTAGSGNEGRIRIVMPSGTTLNDITSVSWREYLSSGYPPHLDIKVDTNSDGVEDDALVFEYAYNSESHYAEAPMPYGALAGTWYQTFSDDGNGPIVVDDTANAWLSSGPSGPLGDSNFIYGTLTQWKAGTVSGSAISGSTSVIALEIEIDDWVVQSEAYVDGIEINGVTYFGSIQDAVDESSNGDTINVAAGTYTENVNVNKQLTLQGASSATVTVNAASSASSVFTVTASSVSISGFTLSGATGGGQAGIYLGAGVDNCNIFNNILTNNFDGIWLGSGSNHNTLTNNTLSSNYQGFEVYISSDNTFNKNTVNSNNNYGFKIDSGNNNQFTNNTANSNGKYGFYIVIGDGGGTTNSIFVNNTANLNTQYGMRMNGGSGNILIGNTFDSNVLDGIKLKETITSLTMTNNTINNSPIGIEIDVSVIADVTTWTVNQNTITGNTVGLSNLGTGILNTENNWWGNNDGPEWNGQTSGTVDYSPFCLDSGCATTGTGTDPLVNAGTDKLTNAQFTQDATASDSGSGIASYAWTKQSGPGAITFGTSNAEDTTISADADGAYVIRFTVTDTAGNSAYDEMNLVWDTTPPTVSSVSSDGQIYNTLSSNPTITITFSENASSPTVHVDADVHAVTDCGDADAKTWCFGYVIPTETVSTPIITVSGSSDAAGNLMIDDSSHTFEVDTIVPTLTSIAIYSSNSNSTLAKTGDTITIMISESEALLANPTVTISGSPALVVPIASYAATYTMAGSEAEGVVPFTIDFTDAAGNPGAQATTTTDGSYILFDKTPPTTTDDAPSGWQNADVNIVLTPTDTWSGISDTKYCVDLVDACVPSESSNNVTVSSEGTKYVRYFSIDGAGNIEPTKSATVEIDKSPPTISVQSPEGIVYNVSTIDVNFTATDTLSGVSSCWYTLDNTTNNALAGCSNETIANLSDGAHMVRVYSMDSAGSNTSASPISFYINTAGSPTVIANSTNVTVDSNSTNIMVPVGQNITDISVPSTISDDTNVTLDLSLLVTADSASKNVSINNNLTLSRDTSSIDYTVNIPAGTTITGDTSWTGIINVPTVKATSTVTPTPDSGTTASVTTVVEVGYGDTKLTFDHAVRLLITGQAGKLVGYSRSGTFYKITATCSADTQAAGDALAAEGDCKIDVGSDLVIWTKHFTSFATYDQTANPPAPPSGGGGGGGGCLTEWNCTEWSQYCIDNVQVRTCTKVNPLCAAGFKPNETQPCPVTQQPVQQQLPSEQPTEETAETPAQQMTPGEQTLPITGQFTAPVSSPSPISAITGFATANPTATSGIIIIIVVVAYLLLRMLRKKPSRHASSYSFTPSKRK